METWFRGYGSGGCLGSLLGIIFILWLLSGPIWFLLIALLAIWIVRKVVA